MVLAFIFGLIFGSFLNVVIYRLKTPQWRGGTAENIIFGRSFCPDCGTQLKWHDLVPVLSFIWLRGRCRYCKKKISWQYPIVEVLSGFIWVLVFWKVCFYINFSPYGRCPEGTQFLNLLNPLNLLNLLNFFYYIFIFSALLVIAIYDFKWHIILNKIVYPAIAAALIFNFLKSLNFETLKLLNFETFILSLLTACAAFLFFFSIFYFSSGRAMGLGDAKLAILIGLFLSPTGALMTFALAFIIGAIFGIILMAISKVPNSPFYKKWAMKSQIAFGPFLVISAVIVLFFSDFIFKFIKF